MNAASSFQRIADVDVLVRTSNPHRASDIAVILLHGYGANFVDLAGVADVVDRNQHCSWYFPNGLLEIPVAANYVGRAWFPIDMQRLELALSRGDERPFQNIVPDGLGSASAKIKGLLSDLKHKYQRVIIGGFSQGAMVSCDVALADPELVDGLWQLSGNMLAKDRWLNFLSLCKPKFSIYQSHGRFDQVLPFKGAEDLRDMWQSHELPYSFTPFQGGHEIPHIVLMELQKYLEKLISTLN